MTVRTETRTAKCPLPASIELVGHRHRIRVEQSGEDRIGTLEAGKYADLVVLDRDYMTVPIDEIRDLKPELRSRGSESPTVPYRAPDDPGVLAAAPFAGQPWSCSGNRAL